MRRILTNGKFTKTWQGCVRKWSSEVGIIVRGEFSSRDLLLGSKEYAELNAAAEAVDNEIFDAKDKRVVDFIASHKLDAESVSMERLSRVLPDFHEFAGDRAQKLRLVLGPVEVIDRLSSEIASRNVEATNTYCRMLAELRQIFMREIQAQIPEAVRIYRQESIEAPAVLAETVEAVFVAEPPTETVEAVPVAEPPTETVEAVPVAGPPILVPLFPHDAGRECDCIIRVRKIFDNYVEAMLGEKASLTSESEERKLLMGMKERVLKCLEGMKTLSKKASDLFGEIAKNRRAHEHLFLKQEQEEWRSYFDSLGQLREELTCPGREIGDLFAYIDTQLQKVSEKRNHRGFCLFPSWSEAPAARMLRMVRTAVEKGLSDALPGHGASISRAKHLAKAPGDEGESAGSAPAVKV